jgi:hypothetical protein
MRQGPEYLPGDPLCSDRLAQYGSEEVRPRPPTPVKLILADEVTIRTPYFALTVQCDLRKRRSAQR